MEAGTEKESKLLDAKEKSKPHVFLQTLCISPISILDSVALTT